MALVFGAGNKNIWDMHLEQRVKFICRNNAFNMKEMKQWKSHH